MTPHINAPQGAFADIVLMPGDPLRAKYIAEHFLQNAELVTSVRNMLGYTGTYKGRRVSVMGHGMGIPSCSIYAKELITEYGVKKLIRIGSCGALSENIKIRDIIIALGACTDSNVNRIRFKGYDFAAIADFDLVQSAVKTAQDLNTPIHIGNVFTSDLFYTPDTQIFDIAEKHGVLGVEMETAGFYGVAAEFGAKAMAMMTVSDHMKTGEQIPAEERQLSFNEMITLALEIALFEKSE